MPLAVPAAYPIAIAVAYVGLLFLGVGVSIYSTMRVFVVALALSAMIGVICNRLMGDRDRGGLLALTIVILLIAGTNPVVLAILLGAVGLIVVERLIASRRGSSVPWTLISTSANVAGVIFMLTFVVAGIEQGGFARVLQEMGPVGSAPAPAPASSRTERPDVYVVVLDGYARPDKMLDLFGFDDSSFIKALEDRGFEASPQSRSNYIMTTLSIPSLLNMRHVHDLFVATPTGSVAYRTHVRTFVSDSDVAHRFRALGYHVVAVSSGFDEVVLRKADEVIDTGQVSEYELLMMRETALASIVSAVSPQFFADQHRSRTVAILEAAAALAARPHAQPLFAFVHVPSPHGPIVFGPTGDPVTSPDLAHFYDDTALTFGLSRQAFGQRYVGQVTYLNGLVLPIVDAILKSSQAPPVILILSDHGSGSGLDWDDLAHSDLDERTANLFLAYTPGRPHLFEDDITLVNTFPRLLDGYFGYDIADQPDLFFRWDDSYSYLVQVPELQQVR